MLALRSVRSNLNLVQWVRNISSTSRSFSAELNVHRDTPVNNARTPFDFTVANYERLTALIGNYPVGCERSVVLAALDIVQRQVGWVPISAMHKIADLLAIPRVRVYDCCTFYTMNKRRFRGLYHVKVCVTTPCMIRGSDVLLKDVEEQLGCPVGGLSGCGLFGVDTVQCAGACANAPVVVVNDDYYEDCTRENVKDILNALKAGCIPPPGPQSGRTSCEPITGQTTLNCPPNPPGFGLQPALCGGGGGGGAR